MTGRGNPHRKRTLTRAALAEAAYVKSTLPRVEVADLTGQLFEAIEAVLDGGAVVKIAQFGRFVPVTAAARSGRDPKHPERRYPIPAHIRVAFRASPELRRIVDRRSALAAAHQPAPR